VNLLDCLVIGGGPAGLTAATYLGRSHRVAKLIDAGQSRASLIPVSHNYPGFRGIAGPELLQRLRDQASQYGAQLETGEVTSLARKPDGVFVAQTLTNEIRARTILLATGLIDKRPIGLIDGARSSVIRFCPICDGYEATDKRIGVLGSLEHAGTKALFLRTYSQSIVLFADDAARDSCELSRAGVVVETQPSSIHHRRDGVSVIVPSGQRYELDCLYVSFGCTIRSELATALGAQCTDAGTLCVDGHQRTSVPGLYAAGDVVSDLHQMTVATGHATIAAASIHNSLHSNWR
jgi:thioredoxin reductase (NADPH)